MVRKKRAEAALERRVAEVAELPEEHEWEWVDNYRGEILVDIFTCKRCRVSWQRTVPEPGTPDELLGWSAWLAADDDQATWDDETYLPDCIGEGQMPVARRWRQKGN